MDMLFRFRSGSFRPGGLFLRRFFRRGFLLGLLPHRLFQSINHIGRPLPEGIRDGCQMFDLFLQAALCTVLEGIHG